MLCLSLDCLSLDMSMLNEIEKWWKKVTEIKKIDISLVVVHA